VDSVEKLSTENVENPRFIDTMWIVWKSYPPKMWKTDLKNHLSRGKEKPCGKCGKVIHKECGKLEKRASSEGE